MNGRRRGRAVTGGDHTREGIDRLNRQKVQNLETGVPQIFVHGNAVIRVLVIVEQIPDGAATQLWSHVGFVMVDFAVVTGATAGSQACAKRRCNHQARGACGRHAVPRYFRPRQL